MDGKKISRRGPLALLMLAAALQMGVPGTSRAHQVKEDMNVWFDVLFDENGQVKEITPIDEASQSPGFWKQMTARLQKARVPPHQVEGRQATFRTGVRLYLAVDKEKSTVGIRSMEMMPIPTKLYYAAYPDDAAALAGWEGEIRMVCRVGVDGTCVESNVEMPAGMPQSLKRYGRTSMAQWRFKPQEVDGKPVEGEYIAPLRFRTDDDMPVDFREPRKL